jgi:hypothetical protein
MACSIKYGTRWPSPNSLGATDNQQAPCQHEIGMGIDERSIGGKCVGVKDAGENGREGETEVRFRTPYSHAFERSSFHTRVGAE